MKLVFSALVSLAAALALGACDDPFDVDATFEVNTDTLTVYALDNVEGSYYNGIRIVTVDADNKLGPEVVPIVGEAGGGPLDFDVAVDIAPDGRAIFYPLNVIAPGAADRTVGLATTTQSFDQIGSAPRVEYESGEPVVRAPGEVLLIESFSSACRFSVSARGTNYYAKLVVDSIRTTPVERIFVRVTSDPNCGFRSFAPGIPGS